MGRFASIVVLVSAMLVSAIAISSAREPATDVSVASIPAPYGLMPSMMRRAGPETEQAYRAALTHAEVLDSVPCLCGCIQSLGHRSNLDCYIADTYWDGTVEFSTHGVYCAVCQAITRDAVAGAAAGLGPAQLRALILERYGGS